MISPKVSVIMPNYNCEKYITEAIESILHQSFTDFEFIIIDDGSTDKSWEIIQEYAQKDPRIVAMRNSENMKICKTLNKWLEIAQWEYIARMDSDDISLPSRLEKQVLYLDKNQNIWGVWSCCFFIDKHGVQWAMKKYPEDNLSIRASIWQRNPILHPSIIFRKKCYKELGGYDDDFLYAEDLDLWVRYGEKYSFHNLQEPLILYRIFGWNSTLKKQKLMIRNTLKIRKKAMKMGYRIWCKWVVFYIGTWCMQFLPARFVLWLFNLVTTKNG